MKSELRSGQSDINIRDKIDINTHQMIMCTVLSEILYSILQPEGLRNTIKKVKWSHYGPGVAQRVGRGIVLLFHNRGTRRGWVVSSTLRPHFNPRKTRYPFYRKLGGFQGRSGRAGNLLPTGIRPWTVQLVVSRYTDWATGPIQKYSKKIDLKDTPYDSQTFQFYSQTDSILQYFQRFYIGTTQEDHST